MGFGAYIRAMHPKEEAPPTRGLSREEASALRHLRMEAENAGSVLRGSGRGGFPPSRALEVFRKADYKCPKCGNIGSEDNGGLTIHHKAGARNLVSDALLRRAREKPKDLRNLTAICHRCHDAVHDDNREAAT